jgi:hypothetical protein
MNDPLSAEHDVPMGPVFIPKNRIVWDAPAHDKAVGYRALWLKVIIRAAFDWVSYRDSLKLEQRKEAERAYKWLFLPSEMMNSFENVCQLIDIPAPNIRVWVSGLTKEHVAKIEHLERESSSPVALAEAERNLIEDVYHDGDDDR